MWLSKHILSSSFRPATTRDGNLLKNGVEKLTFEDFSKLLTCATSEFQNRPHVAMSVWAGAMQTTLPILREAQGAGIIGEGDFLLQRLGPVAASLGVMNTLGDAGMLRSHESFFTPCTTQTLVVRRPDEPVADAMWRAGGAVLVRLGSPVPLWNPRHRADAEHCGSSAPSETGRA